LVSGVLQHGSGCSHLNAFLVRHTEIDEHKRSPEEGALKKGRKRMKEMPGGRSGDGDGDGDGDE